MTKKPTYKELVQKVKKLEKEAVERKEAEKALLESEGRFKDIAENALEWIWEVDANGKYTYASPVVEKILGYTPEEVLKKHFYDLFHPENRKELKKAAFKVFAQKQPFRKFINQNMHKNGKTVWLSTSGVPMLDEKGNLLGYRGADIDITERKQAEEELRNERDFNKTLIDASPTFFVAIDADYKTLIMNKAMLQTLGYTLDEVIGTDYLTTFVPDEDHKMLSAIFKTLSKQHQPTRNQNRVLTKDGRELLVEWYGRPIFNARNEFEFFFGVGIDITKQKKVEAEAQKLRDELAHVSRVTMMGEFVASLAHELNQPLTAILSNVQAAQRFLDGDTPNLDEVRDILSDIVKDDIRAVEVIKELRALCEKNISNFQPLDINEAIKEIISLIRDDITKKHVSIVTEFATDLPLVLGDRVQLQQVVLNLIMNGSEAMADTEPALRKLIIRTERQDKQNIKVAVQDFGTGLKDKNENIFEPFHTTKSEGMGMGLSISRSIVEAHEGLLQAVDNPDKGATFWFTIPIGKFKVS